MAISLALTVTDAKTHESRIIQVMELPKGSIIVFDRGYISYPLGS